MNKAQIRFALRMMAHGETKTIMGKAVRKVLLTTPRAHAGPVTEVRYAIGAWYGDTAATVDKLA